MFVVVQTMDRYARKTPKTLVVVQNLDRYEHCTHLPPTVLWLERAYRWKKEWKGQEAGMGANRPEVARSWNGG